MQRLRRETKERAEEQRVLDTLAHGRGMLCSAYNQAWAPRDKIGVSRRSRGRHPKRVGCMPVSRSGFPS